MASHMRAVRRILLKLRMRAPTKAASAPSAAALPAGEAGSGLQVKLTLGGTRAFSLIFSLEGARTFAWWMIIGRRIGLTKMRIIEAQEWAMIVMILMMMMMKMMITMMMMDADSDCCYEFDRYSVTRDSSPPLRMSFREARRAPVGENPRLAFCRFLSS